jgi:hypothetical protein
MPYKRFPRTPIPPPAIELTVVELHGVKAVATPAITYNQAHRGELLHHANLLLELFGECSTLTENLEPFLAVERQRLNWTILPPGEMPWARLSRRVAPFLDQMGERTRPVAEHRLKMMTEEHTPSFTAVGNAGFDGYLVFGFEDKGVYVLESLNYGGVSFDRARVDGRAGRLAALPAAIARPLSRADAELMRP